LGVFRQLLLEEVWREPWRPASMPLVDVDDLVAPMLG
jgi:hypothetical protein